MIKHSLILFLTTLISIYLHAQTWHLTSTHNTDLATHRMGSMVVSIDIDSLEMKLRMNEKNYYHDIVSKRKEGDKVIFAFKMDKYNIIGVLDKKAKTFDYVTQVQPSHAGTQYKLDTLIEILPPVPDSVRKADSIKKLAAKKVWDVEDTTADTKPVEDTTVYSTADKMPEYPGGKTAMLAYLQKHVHYPKQARQNNVRGFVALSVVIEKNGKVGLVSVKHSLSDACDECDAEAIRAVKSMPAWTAGTISDEPKRVSVDIPVSFFPDAK